MKKLLVLLLVAMLSLSASAQAQFARNMKNAAWAGTKYGFKIPTFMKGGKTTFVNDVPADVVKYWSDKVTVSCWPGLGTWAVDGYPSPGDYLTDKVKVRNVTYSANDVHSGYATDGRIFYMKKSYTSGGEVTHAYALVVIYPKTYQSVVGPFIDMIKNWKM